MGRELKFRVWDKKEEKYSKSAIMYFFDIIHKKIKRYVLEQYTGLKDKNGKEIYEGDIVKMPDWQTSPRTEIVKYHKAGFDPFQEGCLECWSADGEEVEVIGNIHENPELLNA